MPESLTYPGVYIEELPSGVRTITGVATSITAFVGRTRKGSAKDPVTINSFADFERKFGGLWKNSAVSYAVRDFYLNGGSQAIIVRLFKPIFADDAARNAALAAATVTASPGAMAVANAISGVIPAAAPVYPAVPPTAQQAYAAGLAAAALVTTPPEAVAAAKAILDLARTSLLTAKTRSDLAAHAATVALAEPAGSERDAANAVAAAAAASAANPAATSQLDVLAAATNAASSFAGGSPERTAAENVAKTIHADILADAQSLVAAATSGAAVNQATNMGAAAVAPLGRARIDYTTLALEAANEGAWCNALRIRVDYDVDQTADDKDTLFNLSVQLVESSGKQTEVFRNLSMMSGHKRNVTKVLENESSLARIRGSIPAAALRPTAHPAVVGSDNPFDTTKATSSGVTSPASDGQPLSIAADFGDEAAESGIYALRKADLFNLLCIPPCEHTPDANVKVPEAVWGEAAKLCEDRRAMLIVDSPDEWHSKDAAKGDGSSTGIAKFRNDGTKSPNAALFFPGVLQPNPLRADQKERFAACGVIAGVFARTDTQRGVWKAPAGLEATLVGVPELAVKLTDAENGELNPLGVNCLRNLPAAGNVVWGSRTMDGDDRLASQWKYIPVRRTALYIEESLYRGTQWVVFEPNDEPLWSQIRLNIGAFMHGLFRQGAFQGKTPREAYFVKCDSETTTQDDINKGIVNIVVGFAPLKPAEFVVIKLQQLAGQIQA